MWTSSLFRRYHFPIMASERVQRQIDRLLDEAEEAISRYDWEAVRQAALAVLAIDPGNSDPITNLAGADRALGATSTLPPITEEVMPAFAQIVEPPPGQASIEDCQDSFRTVNCMALMSLYQLGTFQQSQAIFDEDAIIGSRIYGFVSGSPALFSET